MALTKRIRFEILRRDGNACRYCGATAPDAKLTIDHVIPVALGGSDDPDNLVTACRDCNAGKSATAPDQALVADVSASALRWAEAMKLAGEVMLKQSKPADDYVKAFEDEWGSWRTRWNGMTIDLPPAYREAVTDLYRAQLPREMMVKAVEIALTARGVESEFSYFMGVCRNMLREQAAVAEALLNRDEA